MEMVGIPAARWVVGKALRPLSSGLLEAWGATFMLGSNMEVLKMQLLYAQGMLNNVRGREIHNPALGELLDKLRQLAYGAEDVLDELDYFRIQDELDGTYDAADAHAAGFLQDLALNTCHTARAYVNKLKLPVCSRAGRHDEQHDGGKQGYLSGLHFCGSREISSSPPSPANQIVEEVHGGCMPKVASSAREASHAVGKHFTCYSFPSVNDDDPDTGMVGSSSKSGNGRRFLCGAWQSSKAPQKNRAKQASKLKFNRVEMSTKIKDITEQLKPVCGMVSTILKLELLGSSSTTGQETTINRPKTTPEITEPKLYGRDSQKKIVEDEMVNSECHELTVLPIVGPGGIGKTTFTQHIYDKMKSRFQVPIWICVSFDFNANRLAKDIVEKIPKVNNEEKNCSAEQLIKQRIKGKRVLLVLDDVWTPHEDEWKKLLVLFKKEGENGNMVIVTTRIPQVANMVKTTKCSLELEHLCPEDIMSLFEECVFGDQKPWDGHLELNDVGKKIVEKLKGSPLAAKTVGRLLRNKLTLNHWRSILESKEWELQTDENDIMPALKLSYDYLPFHLQQCFSSCALFPEDYEFGSEELVHLWIGLDILHSRDHKRKRTEDVGLCYLNDLVDYGFFIKMIRKDERPYYVIHDFLHELAVKVSSYECLTIHSSNVRYIQIPPSVRHLSIIVDSTDVKDRMSFEDYNGNLSALNKQLKVEHLRTLMLFGDYHGSFAKTFGGLFREATALRVILLSEASYNLEDILHNFSKLVHLRYLRIKSLKYWDLCLPRALFRLYHLEVLDLQSVPCFGSSTRDMSKLVKLHHFLVPKDKLQFHSDIIEVGKLKLFQELKEFRVGKESEGFELSQLGQLTEIGGSLGIYNLENVQTKEEANELKLIHKNHVRKLILEWDAERSNKDPLKEENILESLVPHTSLQVLCIRGHGGSSCPTWLCTNLSVKCLVSLCLDGVSWKNLPPLGETWMVNEHGKEYQGCGISPPNFLNLKKLKLINISLLKKWVGNGGCLLFSNLEVLMVRDCSELVELPFSNSTCYKAHGEDKMAWFSRLRELVIENCPKLASVPPIPWRKGAPCYGSIIGAGSGIKKLVYPSEYFLPSKLGLEIEGDDGQGELLWSGLKFSNLTGLEALYVDRIPPLPLDELLLLKSLKRMEIEGSSSVLPPVQSAGHGIYRFPIEDLTINRCATSGEELTLLLSFLPNLSTLQISLCQNITRLGVAGHVKTVSEEQQTGGEEEIIITEAAAQGLLLLPSHLQELEIEYCDNITGLGVAKHVKTVSGEQQTGGEEEIIITEAAAQGLLLLPTHLEVLTIFGCGEISLLSTPPHDDQAAVEGGLRSLHSLRSLSVYECPEFLSSYSSPSSSFFPFPTCLQELTLFEMEHMDTLQALSNLTSLTQLKLYRCEGSLQALSNLTSLTQLILYRCEGSLQALSNLTSLTQLILEDLEGSRAEGLWPLLAHGCLTKLTLNNLPDFFAVSDPSRMHDREVFSRSSKLLDLGTSYNTGFLAAPICSLFSSALTRLDLSFDYEVEHLTKEQEEALQLLTSLQELRLQLGSKLLLLPAGLHKLINLKELSIWSCYAIRSLPNLPSSLRKLGIYGCGALKSLPNSLPRSLEILTIWNCKAIKSLPKDGLPSSLRELDVTSFNSEELKRECRKLIGTIPIIRA